MDKNKLIIQQFHNIPIHNIYYHLDKLIKKYKLISNYKLVLEIANIFPKRNYIFKCFYNLFLKHQNILCYQLL